MVSLPSCATIGKTGRAADVSSARRGKVVKVRYSCSVLAALLMMGGGGAAFAQRPQPGGPGNPGNPTTGPMTGQIGTMTQGDVQGLADFVDSTRRLGRKDLQPKSTAIKRSKIMLDALHIACELTDAEQIGSGKSTVGGQPVDIGLYETACSNGMGYLLTLVGKASASGISCFAASATQPGDTSDPAKVDTKCHLPADQDLNAMATTVMRNAGTACDAHGVQWLGQSGSPVLDYTEVACKEGEGFVLRSPAPGSIGAAIDVLSCSDAAKHGAQCQLSAPAVAAASAPAATGGGPPPEGPRPDLQWFKDALKKNGVACDVKKARVVGRESIKRRYIVEYQCPQQPQGLVAYVPSPGDTAGVFESIDCAAADERKLACQFAGAH
jgi:hypothetical protein